MWRRSSLIKWYSHVTTAQCAQGPWEDLYMVWLLTHTHARTHTHTRGQSLFKQLDQKGSHVNTALYMTGAFMVW